MHTSLLLAIWAVLAYLLYALVAFVLTELHHRRNARALNCKPAYSFQGRDPFGIDNIQRVSKADNEYRIPQYLQDRTTSESVKEGRLITTFTQRIFNNRNFFTFDPRNIQAVLATQFKDFGFGHVRCDSFGVLLGKGIFATDGKLWEHSRALLRPQFAREQISDLDAEECHLQNMMLALPTNPDGWTNVTDLKSLFFRLTIDSATEFLFGQSVGSQLQNIPGREGANSGVAAGATDFGYHFDEAQSMVSQASRLDNFWWLLKTKEFVEHCRRCHEYIDHYVQLALSKEKGQSQSYSGTGKPKYVLLDALAEETRDPIQLRDEVLNILLAGRDTTASLLSFIFIVFDKHPETFKRLRSVVIEEFGTYTNSKEITFSNLKNCAYLQWFLNETLRLYPVVPLDGRRALKDTTLPFGGGPDGNSPVYIRKGQAVDYGVVLMHRRKDLWGPDAEEFKPERWNGRKSGWEYLPFNGGPRICIGQQFALTKAGYVTVRLLQRFEDFQGVGNTWEPVEKGGMGFVRQRQTLTSSPADGVHMRLKEARE